MINEDFTSRNKYDANAWVIRVIESCENIEQLWSAHRLKVNFFDVYYDKTMEKEQQFLWEHRKLIINCRKI
jgi:hypothetical protein